MHTKTIWVWDEHSWLTDVFDIILQSKHTRILYQAAEESWMPHMPTQTHEVASKIGAVKAHMLEHNVIVDLITSANNYKIYNNAAITGFKLWEIFNIHSWPTG